MTNSSNETQKPVTTPVNPQHVQGDKQQNQGDNKKPESSPQQK